MKKYFLIAKSAWDEIVIYRLNFSLWRIRQIFLLLTSYFLWLAVLPPKTMLGGYSQAMILTYILGGAVISSLIFSNRSFQIGDDIESGDLSNYLLRPLNYFRYYFAKDIGDKLMNACFAAVEITILFLILKPPFVLQNNAVFLLFFFCSVFFAIILNFFINLFVSLMAFWIDEVWPLRFLLTILLTFFAGGLFPLNLLPSSLFSVFQLLPVTYLLYFPMKIYLGQVTAVALFWGFATTILWIFILERSCQFVWKKGMKVYSASGR
ncbi:MAG TPA: ABC-2 family transporter protein [Patescibacteria group bacterium]|nr:ABC-2 family transporter protein [Patescibacteria group bacterium]